MIRSAMRSLEEPPGFDFDCDGGFDAVGHMVEFDERSVADEFGKGIVDGHGVSLQMIVYWLPMDDFVVFDFEKLAFVTCNDLKRDL